MNLNTTQNEDTLDPTLTAAHTKSLLDKIQTIRLLFPYEMNKELKKYGARFNSELKIWYYPSINNHLPEELKPYRAYKIEVDNKLKEYLKPVLPSLRYDKNEQQYYINQTDYTKYLELNTP